MVVKDQATKSKSLRSTSCCTDAQQAVTFGKHASLSFFPKNQCINHILIYCFLAVLRAPLIELQ